MVADKKICMTTLMELHLMFLLCAESFANSGDYEKGYVELCKANDVLIVMRFVDELIP